jgi:hypothetical protein
MNEAITTMNGGIASPKLDIRIDLDKYKSMCKRVENMLPWPHGAIEKRPGTKFIYDATTEPSV